MNREDALLLIKKYVKTENSIKHMLAVEAVMAEMAKLFEEDPKIWGLAGLLHDIDMEIVDYKKESEKHGIVGAKILEEAGVSKTIIEAVKAHNPATGKKPITKMEKAIYCADPLTGLIVASVLVIPSKNIMDLTSESVLKRFKEKNFAKGANRDIILSCQELGITLNDFVQLGLKSMQSIKNELGL